MLFNSTHFGIFYAIILALFWVLHKHQHARNAVLLAGSMFFYGYLHISFPFYLATLIGISYLFARKIEKTANERRRQQWMVAAICTLAIGLVYTKYGAFLASGISGLQRWQADALGILVPVGISFYTFATIGYVLDVYFENTGAERNILTYASYISFFPHLLLGPIPAATTILPQFREKPKLSISDVDEALGEFLWGLFKKMVVADNISMAVSFCFSKNNMALGGSSLFVGAALFGVFVYADFSAYSSMARGIAKLFGINLVQNFRTPFFSSSVGEYWRRWHISLTTWLFGFIYNPLVYNFKRWGKAGIIAAIFVTFLVSGIWHGTGWQYIIFGVVNGLAIILEILTRDARNNLWSRFPAWVGNLLGCLAVMVFMLFSWIFFRAASVGDALTIIRRICSPALFSAPDTFVLKYIKWCVPLIVVEFAQRNAPYIMDVQHWLPAGLGKTGESTRSTVANTTIKVALYTTLCVCIYIFHKKVNIAEYYYFKF